MPDSYYTVHVCCVMTTNTTAAENSLIHQLNLDCITHGWKLQEITQKQHHSQSSQCTLGYTTQCTHPDT